MTRKNLWFVALVVVLLAVMLAGCTQQGAAPAATATKAPAAASPAGGAASPAAGAAGGQAVFQTNCNGCHPNGDKGVGPALKNTALSVDQIKTQVRNGKGQMPAFPASQISDAQLDALAQYVKTLK